MPIEFAFQDLYRTARVLLPPLWKEDHAAFGLRPTIFVLHDEDPDAFAVPTAQGLIVRAEVVATGDWFEAVARFSDLVYGQDTTDQHQSTSQDLTHGRFVVVLVDGVAPGFEPLSLPNEVPLGSFNSGHRGRDAAALAVEDVSFLQALFTEVEARLSADLGAPALDPARVFAAGMGNGGEMAYRLGAQWLVNGFFPLRGIAAFHASNGGYAAYVGGLPVALPSASWRLGNPVPKVLALGGQSDVDFVIGALPATSAVTSSATKRLLLEARGFDDSAVPLSYSIRWSLEESLALFAPVNFLLWGYTSVFGDRSFFSYRDPAGGGWFGTEIAALIEQEQLGHVWPHRGGFGPAGLWDGAREVWDFFAAELP